MEEYKRPLTERDKKILNEMKIAQKLRREEGCKFLDCGVVTNNINLRIEIIDLKRKTRELEKVIELMADYIDIYGECVDSSKKPCEKAHCKECIIEFFRKKAKGE